MDARKKAAKDYAAGMKYKEISAKYGVPIGTLKSWRARDGWKKDATATSKVQPKQTKDAPKVAPPVIDELENNSELTDKQKLFCTYYMQRFNASWAYMKAYKVSFSTAYTAGPRLLGNVVIKKQLEELKKAQAADVFITANDILAEYAKQATSNYGDFVKYDVQDVIDEEKLDANGEPLHYSSINIRPEDMDKVDMSLVKSMHRGKDGFVVELYDKQKAQQVLLDRLPEVKLTDEQRDNFISALFDAHKKE